MLSVVIPLYNKALTIAYADTQKINRTLGYKSDRTLEDALKSAWKWQ